MRIFTKKAYGFKDPAVPMTTNPDHIVRTRPGEFQDVPDRVAGTKLFQAGLRSGNIEIIQKKTMVQVPGDLTAGKKGKKAKNG